MAAVYVDCWVENVKSRHRFAEIQELRVEPRSHLTWLPEDLLKEIKIRAEKRFQKVTKVNGEVVERHIGYAIIKTSEFETVDEIVFGQDDDPNLLGARTLTGFGAVVDAERELLVAAGPFLAASNAS